MEGEHHPGQQVNRLTDENQIAGKSVPRDVVQFSRVGRFEDEGMRGKRLASEEGAVVGDGGFKAFGINAFLRELALFLALTRRADAGDAAEDIAESAAEDVALVLRHPQRFTDGVGEPVACEAEVLEHGVINSLQTGERFQ